MRVDVAWIQLQRGGVLFQCFGLFAAQAKNVRQSAAQGGMIRVGAYRLQKCRFRFLGFAAGDGQVGKAEVAFDERWFELCRAGEVDCCPL
jgi:hypothetical protein